MSLRIVDMREKQVICLKSGAILGCVGDVEVDSVSGKVVNIIIFGRPKFWGILGRCEDIILPWDTIQVIGRDAMLVNFEPPNFSGRRHRRRGNIWNIFNQGYKN